MRQITHNTAKKVAAIGLLFTDYTGDGFSDILIEPEDPDAGIVIEVKYASSVAGFEKSCEEALKQIREKRYDERLRNDGRTDVLTYGIAFCRKRCKVICERAQESELSI